MRKIFKNIPQTVLDQCNTRIHDTTNIDQLTGEITYGNSITVEYPDGSVENYASPIKFKNLSEALEVIERFRVSPSITRETINGWELGRPYPPKKIGSS